MRDTILGFITLPALALALGSACACARTEGDKAWLRFRDAQQVSGHKWSELPQDRIQPLASAYVAEAITLLGQTSFHELTPQEIARFQLRTESAGGLSWYLIRAVANAGTARTFTVLTDGNAVVVHQGSLAKHSKWQKDVVAVSLERAPTQVFVEVTAAE